MTVRTVLLSSGMVLAISTFLLKARQFAVSELVNTSGANLCFPSRLLIVWAKSFIFPWLMVAAWNCSSGPTRSFGDISISSGVTPETPRFAESAPASNVNHGASAFSGVTHNMPNFAALSFSRVRTGQVEPEGASSDSQGSTGWITFRSHSLVASATPLLLGPDQAMNTCMTPSSHDESRGPVQVNTRSDRICRSEESTMAYTFNKIDYVM